jgi:type IV pilus assembly protein PilA
MALMKEPNSGFTLIELLIVIAIIGILAAVAVPFYEGYKIKAKLAEVENAMSTVGSSISSFYHENNIWPNCPTVNEVRNSLGVSLGSITRISGISVVNGGISVTIQNIAPMVDGKSLTLTPDTGIDGSLSWRWGWSPDFPPHLRPKGN